MSLSNTDTEKSKETITIQKKPKFDQLRADHELFLKAFESEFIMKFNYCLEYFSIHVLPIYLYLQETISNYKALLYSRTYTNLSFFED